jgi:hypothetical protein
MRSSARQVAASMQSSQTRSKRPMKTRGALPRLAQLFFLGGNGNSRTGRSRRGQRGFGTLMLTVLEDGMRSYLNSAKWIRTEAERWVMNPRQGSPCAFTAACELLGLDPHTVRTALGRLRREKAPRKKTRRRSGVDVRSRLS